MDWRPKDNIYLVGTKLTQLIVDKPIELCPIVRRPN